MKNFPAFVIAYTFCVTALPHSSASANDVQSSPRPSQRSTSIRLTSKGQVTVATAKAISAALQDGNLAVRMEAARLACKLVDKLEEAIDIERSKHVFTFDESEQRAPGNLLELKCSIVQGVTDIVLDTTGDEQLKASQYLAGMGEKIDIAMGYFVGTCGTGEDERIAYMALDGLKKVYDHNPKLIQFLLQANQPRVSLNAWSTLVAKREWPFQLARSRAKDPNAERRAISLSFGNWNYPEDTPQVLRFLSDPHGGVRESAISRIRGLRDHVNELIPLYDWASAPLRCSILSLIDVKKNSDIYGNFIARGLANKDATVRATALHVSERSNFPVERQTLLKLLRDRNASVRAEAVFSFSDQFEKNELLPLVPLLNDRDAEVRSQALRALESSHDVELVKHVLNVVRKDKSIDYRRYTNSMGGLGDAGASIVNELLTDTDPRLRAIAVFPIEEYFPAGAFDMIMAASFDSAPEVRMQAAYLLVQKNTKAAFDRAKQLLHDPDERVRLTVLSEAEVLDSPQWRSVITSLAQLPDYPSAKYAVASAAYVKNMIAPSTNHFIYASPTPTFIWSSIRP